MHISTTAPVVGEKRCSGRLDAQSMRTYNTAPVPVPVESGELESLFPRETGGLGAYSTLDSDGLFADEVILCTPRNSRTSYVEIISGI